MIVFEVMGVYKTAPSAGIKCCLHYFIEPAVLRENPRETFDYLEVYKNMDFLCRGPSITIACKT